MKHFYVELFIISLGVIFSVISSVAFVLGIIELITGRPIC